MEFSTWEEVSDAFDAYLDTAGLITIAGHEFRPNEILHTLHPIAYRVALFDWAKERGYDIGDFDDWAKA